MVERIIDVATRVQDFINKSYARYAKTYHNLDRHGFKIKQELVAKSGLWVGKKRYAQWILNEEGVPASKLDVKGIDSVKSNFPPVFGKFIERLLEDVLRNDRDKAGIDEMILDIQRTMREVPLEQIARPSSVNNIKQYTPGVVDEDKFTVALKGAPMHVKAAINYNDMIRLNGLSADYEQVRSGDKVKTLYLRDNPYGLDVLAFRGYDDPQLVVDYLNEYVDYRRIFEANLSKKLLSFYSALGWGDLPTEQSKLVSKFF